MAADRQLSRDFWLHEFPGFERASESDVSAVAETVARVLQPVRYAMGVPVRVSSWMWWSDGTPREGAHSQPGTVDFVVDDGRTREGFEWATSNLVPAGYIGRLIYEPARSAAEGTPQGEHVHLAPRAAMVEAFGNLPRHSDIQVLQEGAEGEYTFYRVAVAAGWGAGALAFLAAAVFLLARRPPTATT